MPFQLHCAHYMEKKRTKLTEKTEKSQV